VQTDCSPGQLEFQGFHGRRVEGAFDGGRQTSDAGLLLLREVEERTGLLRRFAGCFTDHRRADRIEHTVGELVSQRVLGQALGYEDLNDHDTLRDDALLALASGKRDLTGAERSRDQDRGHALAGRSTLNRLERTPAQATGRYHKIVYDGEAIRPLFVEHFLDAHAAAPPRIILDLDATDDPLHGQQEGRFFHGYYGHYCYLPLYIFCGEFLLWAELRRSDMDASAGSVEALEAIVGRIRARWPEVEIWIRADSGFAREAIMAWCEANGVEDVINVFQWINTTGSSLTDAQAVADIRAHLDTIYGALVIGQVDTFIYRDINFRNVTQGIIMGTFPWPTLTAGLSATNQIPPGVALVINFATSVPRVILRKYLGGWPVSVIDNDGTFNAAIMVSAAAWALALTAGIVGPNGTWSYGYLSPKTSNFEIPVSYSVTDIPGYQRRRKQGRGV